MKRFLLSFLMVSLCSVLFAQTPCVTSFKSGNAGGGNCPALGNDNHYPGYLTLKEDAAYFTNGKVTIYFTSPIPIGTKAPEILQAGPDNGAGGIVTGQTLDYRYAAFNDDITIARTQVVYCYYGKIKSNNIFNGSNSPKLTFILNYPYASSTGTSVTCSGIIDQIPLPVSFKSFSATRNQGSVSLKWETASEQNNKGFYVQRSLGNGEWKDVAFVFSQGERGNSSAVLSYSLNDLNIGKGISQYRLLQVDINGHGKYSEIRSVRGQDEAGKLLVYPNPSNTGNVNILFEDATAAKDVMVNDLAGRTIKQYSSVSGSLEVKGLKSGFYTIKVLDRTTGTATIQKVIVNQK